MVGVHRAKERYSHIGKRHLIDAQRRKCFYCGKFVANRRMTRDHLFPRCGGNTLRLNQVMCCRACNLRKGCRQPTACEVSKARALYVSLGVPAFAM
jgi:5-methylcytosine-specific restriction endonuclease McrA